MPRKNGSVTDPDVIYIAQLSKLLKIRKKLLAEKRKAQRIAASQQKRLEKNKSANSTLSKDVQKMERMQNAKERILDESEQLQKKAAMLVAHLEEHPEEIEKITSVHARLPLGSSAFIGGVSSSSSDPPKRAIEKAASGTSVAGVDVASSLNAAPSSSGSKSQIKSKGADSQK